MDFVRNFWRKHRRKIFVTAGCLGSGYLLYRLYYARARRLADLEREFANERESEEVIRNQMKAHFENIQMIADTATLPHALHYLSCRITEEADVSNVMERLNKGRGTLNPSEKLQLWDQLTLLSFTRTVLSLWAVSMLSLYIRVQVNILGRHLYIDTARGLDSSHLLEDSALIDKDDEKKFLESADFLATNGMPTLISNMQKAVVEVLKGKQLKDVFTSWILQETVIRILDVFMSMGSPHHWVDYLMPEDTRLFIDATSSSNNSMASSGAALTKFDQLMMETREVLASTEFTNVVDMSLKSVTNVLVEEIETQTEGGGLASGVPLAKLIPRLERTIPMITTEPGNNRFLQVIRSVPEVQLFFTLLYSNMPQ